MSFSRRSSATNFLILASFLLRSEIFICQPLDKKSFYILLYDINFGKRQAAKFDGRCLWLYTVGSFSNHGAWFMPRVLAVFVLLWGWAYFYTMYFAPALRGEIVSLGSGMGLVLTIVLAVWVKCSAALKLLFALDVNRGYWFKLSLFTNLCLAVYAIILLFGSPAEIAAPIYAWYVKVLAFGTFILWSAFDLGIYFGTRHFEE